MIPPIRGVLSKWNSLCELIDSTNVLWNNLGSGWAANYRSSDDPRLGEMLTGLHWFRQWEEDVASLPLSANRSKEERNRMFLSHQTWWALQQTTLGFIGLGESPDLRL